MLLQRWIHSFPYLRAGLAPADYAHKAQTSMSTSSIASTRALAAITALQGYYNTTSGLWNTTGWWNSGNCLTVVADYASFDPAFASDASELFSNTYQRAQDLNVPFNQVVSTQRFQLMVESKTRKTNDTLPESRSDLHRPAVRDIDPNPAFPYMFLQQATTFPGFLNDFYDDEGWWALGWIRAFDASNRTETQYLATAESIFEDMTQGWSNGTTNETKCEGVWWNKEHQGINAISNELFLSVAAHLANRVPNRLNYYLNWANKEWSWFKGTGMINPRFNINDGIKLDDCSNNGEPVWTYNQGVILGALVELNKAAPDPSYLTNAINIANAAIKYFADTKGIIKEQCDPYCGTDGEQFKGIFIRNLYYLWEATQQPQFLETIRKNADSIWDNDRGDNNRFGAAWAGPYVNATAGTHSSASDAIFAAAKAENASAGGGSSDPTPASSAVVVEEPSSISSVALELPGASDSPY